MSRRKSLILAAFVSEMILMGEVVCVERWRILTWNRTTMRRTNLRRMYSRRVSSPSIGNSLLGKN